jgi:hypothetical protein
MDNEAGKEFNFAHVLPQEDGKPTTLVVPTSLQMGWVESPPYFCAATKTARDISSNYCNTPIGSLPCHKFVKHVTGDKDFDALPTTLTAKAPTTFRYGLKVYVKDFMSILIPTSQEQLEHVATAVMTGIHDVFPANIIDGNHPISEKKLLKGEGQYLLFKMLLGFDFDGKRKTMWLEEKNGQSSSGSYTVGSEPGTSTGGSRLLNSNRWWQSCDMLLLPSLGAGASSHHATVS